jgi:hypothetical protein
MTVIKNHLSCDIKKAGKWHYPVKSWVIFNKGQFTHICQLWPRFRVRIVIKKDCLSWQYN